MSRLLCSLLLLNLLTAANSAWAQDTLYISDVLYVPMRSGAGNEYRIINAALKSGTPLTRLEQSEDGQWSKVATQSGTVGWIRNQYLIEEMTARATLEKVEAQRQRLEAENRQLKQHNAQLTSNNRDLSASIDGKSNAHSALNAELERIKQLSSGAIDLDHRHRELLQKHAMTQTERDALRAENEHLKNDQSLSFFLYGAGILLVGILLAFILPALKPKKRYSEWS